LARYIAIGRAVDRERDGDPVQVDAVERDLEVAQRVDRHADPADFALGERVVRIQADLRGQVEGDVQPGLAVGDQVLEALVGLPRVAEARVLAHRPGLLAVHQAVDAARERVFTRLAEHRQTAAGLDVGRRVERLHRYAGFVHHGLDRRLGPVVHGAFSRT
jgi:hypothetical protein